MYNSNEEKEKLLKREKKNLIIERKNIKFFGAISASSTIGLAAGLKSLINATTQEAASTEGLIKVAISGGILLLSTNALFIGIQGYNLSKERKKDIEERIKILKKNDF